MKHNWQQISTLLQRNVILFFQDEFKIDCSLKEKINISLNTISRFIVYTLIDSNRLRYSQGRTSLLIRCTKFK